MTTWTVGDRVVCVDAGSVTGSYAGVQGCAGKVTKVAGSNPVSAGGLITVLFDDGPFKTMLGRRLQREVAGTVATTPRLFKKGDRVRVVKVNRGSHLCHMLHAKVGDEFVVEADQTSATSDLRVDGWDCFVDQFALVTPAVEYVKLPNGSVVVVDQVTAGGAKLVAGDYWDPARLTPAEAPKPMPEVPADAETMLRMVDVFLSRNNKQAKWLQSVLAALRGPDEAGVDKASTTIPIRRAALPECAKVAATQWLGGATNMDFNAKPLNLGTNGGHFGGHIQSAVYALRAMGREVK